jgi:hypothetical protein
VDEAASAIGAREKHPADPLSIDPPNTALGAEVHMTVYRKHDTIPHPQPLSSRQSLLIPVLTVVCWLFVQKGCVLTPDISPAGPLLNAETAAAPPAFGGGERAERLAHHASVANEHATGGTQRSKSRSLRHASELLRKAAVLLDKNDRSAIRLILQAIAILKHEIMHGIDAPEYDRISTQPPAARDGAPSQGIRTAPTLFVRSSSSHDSSIAPTPAVKTIDSLHKHFMSPTEGWTAQRSTE